MALVGFVAMAGGPVGAQYPEPDDDHEDAVNGSLTCFADPGVTQVGAEVTISCDARRIGGGPRAVTLTFTITSEPGGPNGDASVGSKSVTKSSDSTGRVSTILSVGSKPGIVNVAIESRRPFMAATIAVQVDPLVVPVSYAIPCCAGGSNAAFAAALLFSQQPSAGPSTTSAPSAAPAVSQGTTIRPPSTGDAGLLAEASSEAPVTVILGVGIAASLVVLSSTRLAAKTQR